MMIDKDEPERVPCVFEDATASLPQARSQFNQLDQLDQPRNSPIHDQGFTEDDVIEFVSRLLVPKPISVQGHAEDEGGNPQMFWEIVTSLCEGIFLRDALAVRELLEANGPLDKDRCIEVVEDLISGMEHIFGYEGMVRFKESEAECPALAGVKRACFIFSTMLKVCDSLQTHKKDCSSPYLSIIHYLQTVTRYAALVAAAARAAAAAPRGRTSGNHQTILWELGGQFGKFYDLYKVFSEQWKEKCAPHLPQCQV
ncbi:hypothetical protein F4780DRAFT_745577 [Xylariomycetidae sp. FL0641]|nr:hypothetical protein F4780DRAFT_745577 [Xylariomycetidae sp. FL0641]